MTPPARFFLWLLLGRKVDWVTQQRDAVGNSWREAFGAHVGQMVLGLAWLTAAFFIEPMLGYWLFPVFGPVALAVPISVWSSRPGPGARLRRANLLATPEETAPPLEYREIISREEKGLSTLSDRFDPESELEGITRVIIDPYVNAVHVSLMEKSATPKNPASVEELAQLKERLIHEGPAGLDQAALRRLANSTELMLDLHRLVWLPPFADLSPWWQHAIEYYRRRA